MGHELVKTLKTFLVHPRSVPKARTGAVGGKEANQESQIQVQILAQ